MRRLTSLCCLLAIQVLGAEPLCAQENNDLLVKALALQRITQAAIAQAEPAIACILVSRSDEYRRLGQPPGPEGSGRLGSFDANFLDSKSGKEERAKLDLADLKHVPESFGSGVVIDPRGLILTNYHVIHGATKVFVRLPGKRGSYADIHAADPRSDLAVLRLIQKGGPYDAIRLGDGDKLERGQFLLSLANPFAAGFRDGQPSASWGILSNLRRRVPTLEKEQERVKPLHYYGILLQTDVRLNLGCSGGALLNLKGELVGLTSAMAAIQGGETPGGFAIPMDAAYRRIIEVLKRGEEVEYGFLGVGPGERGPDAKQGVTIQNITPGSPAEVEGHLRMGDTILAVNGRAVNESDDLFLLLGTSLAGNKVRLDIGRPGVRDPVKVQVALAKFYVPGKKIASSLGERPYYKGLRVDYASLIVQQAFQRLHIPRGVLICDVQSGSAAANALLKTGEVITHVNDIPVLTPAQFYRTVAAAQGTVELTLHTFSHEPPAKVSLK